MTEVVYINHVKQLKVAQQLSQEAAILLNEKLRTVKFVFHKGYCSLPGPLSFSLEKIKEKIRNGCLKQGGFYPLKMNQFFPSSERVVLGRNRKNEIVVKKKSDEAPNIIEEVLEESQNQCWKDQGRIAYWYLGRLEALTKLSEGLLLPESATVLFSKETKKIKEGQIVPVKDQKEEFKACVESHSQLLQVWAK